MNKQDLVTLEMERAHNDYTAFLDLEALEGKRIGVERKPQGKINSCMHFQQKNN
jgi:amidase